MTIMCIIVTEEDMLNLKSKSCLMSIYPSNVSNPRDKTRLKMTLNSIILHIIVTDAQGFLAVKKYLGQAPLAAP